MLLYDSLAPLVGAVFLLLVILQWRFPLRHQHFSQLRRGVRNIVFALPAFLTLRLALLPIPLAMAVYAREHGLGLLNLFERPTWFAIVASIIGMDYAYYWWHIATHRVPLLWRFHNVHHTDLDMDVTTASRFHFGELILSIVFRVTVVAALGIDPIGFLIFELCFEVASQFHHSNWRLLPAVDRTLRFVIVTPRMHGIHHDVIRDHTNSNWGTIFAVWDRLHRTAQLDVPQDSITVGVPEYRDEKELTLGELWTMPFGRQRRETS